MEFDSVLNLKNEVFRDVLGYVEIPRAYAAGGNSAPTFVLPLMDGGYPGAPGAVGRQVSIGAKDNRDGLGSGRSAARVGQARPVALGIGRHPRRATDHELVVYYQDKSQRGDGILQRILDKAPGEVRVAYIGRARAFGGDAWHRKQLDTLRPGASVAHANGAPGTLGCFVIHRGTGLQGLLSNNHVLARSNRARKGDAVRQPAKKDGGGDQAIVGTLRDFVPIRFDTAPNGVDCAWASLESGARQLAPGVLHDSAGLPVGRLAAVTPVDALPELTTVLKVGRTTGYTQGVVDSIVDNLVLDYGNGKVARFDDQIVIRSLSRNPFSQRGDSGSLILSDGYEPVGLLFGGTPRGGYEDSGLTFANPIATILEALELDLML